MQAEGKVERKNGGCWGEGAPGRSRVPQAKRTQAMFRWTTGFGKEGKETTLPDKEKMG